MRLGMVSTYPPRRCGLAGYSAELGRALAPEFDVVVCAVDRHGLTYPDEVAAVVRDDDRGDYRRAARVLAEHGVDVALIQYDDTAFGGPAGAHVLDLADELRRLGLPYVVTVHGMRPGSGTWSRTVAVLAAGAERVLVFTEAARRVVMAASGAGPGRVTVVGYGTPSVIARSRRSGRRAMRDRAAMRPRAALAEVLAGVGPAGGGPVLAMVGFLGPGRGIEAVLDAMPRVLATSPGAQLVIAGMIHPDVAGREGDDYRARLAELIARRGVAGAVRVVGLHLSQVELAALLARTDVFLAPAIAPERACSATVTFAVAAGCAVVAGPHPYPRELLGGGAGVTVAEAEPAALARAVIGYLDDAVRLAAARSAAQARGRRLTWPAVISRYAAILREAGHRAEPVGPPVPALRLDRLELPADRPEHWARLAAVGAGLVGLAPGMLPVDGWRRAHAWVDTAVTALAASAAASPDRDLAAGWGLWGLGAVANAPAGPRPLRERARSLRDILAALPVDELGASAYAVLGLAGDPGLTPDAERALGRAAQRLDRAWQDGAWRGAAWPWFEDRFAGRLGGAGARLPQAMIAAGRRLEDAAMLRRGLDSLDWYVRRAGLAGGAGILRLPTPAGERATDAGAVVEALADAYVAVGASRYGRLALAAFGWFHGANRYATPVYRPEPGVAAAALAATGAGAGSVDGTLAYLGALLRLVAAGLVTLPTVPARDLAAA